jgi:hypothetical protein
VLIETFGDWLIDIDITHYKDIDNVEPGNGGLPLGPTLERRCLQEAGAKVRRPPELASLCWCGS